MYPPKPVPLEDVDLSNLDVFVRNEAWGMFDTLRREAPVFWNPEAGGNQGFWSVTRFADIEQIDKDHETFTSERFVNLEEPPARYMDQRRSMLETDGPRHQALRRLLMRDFSASTLRRYEDFLRGLARLTVDSALQHEEFDFVDAVAADYPINVLARLLDVPAEFTPQLVSWGNEIVGATDPDYARVLVDSPESEQYAHLPFRSPASLEIYEYGRQLAAERRGGSGDDLVSRLVNRMPEDGVPLTSTDFDNYFLLLVVAGNETTRQAISHAMKALMDQPDQLAFLRDHPDRAAVAVEELLRFASPVYHFRRTATRDVELHGQRIKAGDKVVMWFASGNRDESVFADPYRLDLTRYPNEHMTFGKGMHGCLGAHLARLEIRIMFETLLPRLTSIEQAGDIVRVRSNFVNGIKKFPVRVTAQARRPVVTETRTSLREREGDLVIKGIDQAADGVAALTLADPDGAALPPWTPGAHVDLLLGPGLVRQYSLCGSPSDSGTIRVGVLRTPDSRGGSAFVHERLQPGSTVRVRGPRNHFPLVKSPRYLFIAGGVGITPLLPMMAEATAAGADWTLVYGGRSRASMAFLGELAGYGERVTIVPQDELGFPDLDALLGQPRNDTLVYCCGPEGLLAAVEQRCAAWPRGALHVERFAARAAAPGAADRPFELVLARSGRTLTVPAGRSVFDVVQEAGVSVLGSCHEGICGTCEQIVLGGDVDHRDSILNADERDRSETMMICVSRCRSDRLTLDL
ncbi:MAG: cytochrome P450/oxidoreductase [Actinobacteria bacterium]|nr:cytochrome P450/oxidoreductase [Actinomycetota bacterium]